MSIESDTIVAARNCRIGCQHFECDDSEPCGTRDLADRLESGQSIIVPKAVWDAYARMAEIASCFSDCCHDHPPGCLTGCEGSYEEHECPWHQMEVASERLAKLKEEAGL